MSSQPLNTTPETNQVVQHADVPELNILLCGPNPEIFSARPQNKKRTYTFYDPNESQNIQEPRFSNNDDISFDQSPQTTRFDHSTANKQIQNARFFSKLRDDQKFTTNMDDKLNNYQKNRRTKSLILENDYENHFYRPLQHRIKSQITSDKYNQYLEQKQQSIDSMDRNPVPIYSPRGKLPPVATIKFSTEGLNDPTTKYSRRKKEDEKIARLIRNANNEETREPKVTPYQTLDYDRIYAQQKTRFYFGNDPEKGNKSGRKIFENTGISKVGNEINQF